MERKSFKNQEIDICVPFSHFKIQVNNGFKKKVCFNCKFNFVFIFKMANLSSKSKFSGIDVHDCRFIFSIVLN